MPEWAPGDTVWYGTTLYDVADITHDKVILRRHEPLTIRLHPATRCEMLPSVD